MNNRIKGGPCGDNKAYAIAYVQICTRVDEPVSFRAFLPIRNFPFVLHKYAIGAWHRWHPFHEPYMYILPTRTRNINLRLSSSLLGSRIVLALVERAVMMPLSYGERAIGAPEAASWNENRHPLGTIYSGTGVNSISFC